MLIFYIHHLPLTQLTCKLSLSFVRFCQNWTFPTKFSDAKQLACLPLSLFLWIGDNPFWPGCARGCLGGRGRAGTTNQVSSSMLHRALCGYQPQASFCPLTAQTAAKTDPGTLWKMVRKDHRPPLPTSTSRASYDLLHMVYWPYRLDQSEAVMNILLFFENNVGPDWIWVDPEPRGSSGFTVRQEPPGLSGGHTLRGLQRIIYSPARQETNLES